MMHSICIPLIGPELSMDRILLTNRVIIVLENHIQVTIVRPCRLRSDG
jgi:hypothetical protein